MAFGALLRSSERRDPGWLHAAGIWTGLALGAKFSSLPVLVAGNGFWLWRGFPADLPGRMKRLMRYLILTLLLAAPWYLKNAVWFGTPLFPAGLKSNDPEINFRNYLYQEYTNLSERFLNRSMFLVWSFIAPERLDYVTLPWIAPLGLLISVLFAQRMPTGIIGLAGARALLWVLGPPRVRFLLPSLALWGIGIAAAVSSHPNRSRLHRLGAGAMIYGQLALLALLVMGGQIVMVTSRPWAVALGAESRADYLRRSLSGYRAMEWARARLSPEERILLIGDTRHYYCPPSESDGDHPSLDPPRHHEMAAEP
jgi:hypothetical protein